MRRRVAVGPRVYNFGATNYALDWLEGAEEEVLKPIFLLFEFLNQVISKFLRKMSQAASDLKAVGG